MAVMVPWKRERGRVCVRVCVCVCVRAGAPAPSPPRRIVEGGTAAASAAVRGRALSVVLSPAGRALSVVLIQQGRALSGCWSQRGRELSEVLIPAGPGAVWGAEPSARAAPWFSLQVRAAASRSQPGSLAGRPGRAGEVLRGAGSGWGRAASRQKQVGSNEDVYIWIS